MNESQIPKQALINTPICKTIGVLQNDLENSDRFISWAVNMPFSLNLEADKDDKYEHPTYVMYRGMNF